jgi:hypothetical protein
VRRDTMAAPVGELKGFGGRVTRCICGHVSSANGMASGWRQRRTRHDKGVPMSLPRPHQTFLGVVISGSAGPRSEPSRDQQQPGDHAKIMIFDRRVMWEALPHSDGPTSARTCLLSIASAVIFAMIAGQESRRNRVAPIDQVRPIRRVATTS